MPAHYASYELNELYDRFLVIELDKKGNAAIAYGSYGGQISIDIGVNFGELVFLIPKILPLSAGITGSISGTKLKEAVLIVHQNLPKEQKTPFDQKRAYSLWKIRKPVCLMMMTGKSYSLSVSLSFSASIGLKFDGIFTIANLGLNLLGMSLSGELKQTFYFSQDICPSWYENSSKDNLKDAFVTCLETRTAHYLKREIAGWLKHVKAALIDKLPSNDQFNPLKDAFEKLPSYYPLWFKASSEKVKKKIDEIFSVVNRIPNEFRNKVFDDQLDYYKTKWDRLSTAQKEFNITEKKPFGPDLLCYINMCTNVKSICFDLDALNNPVAGTNGGGIGMGIGENYSIPGPTIGAGLKLEGKQLSAFYRYQTFGIAENEEYGATPFKDSTSEKRIVVHTQDTEIYYRKIHFKAGIEAALDFCVGRDFNLDGIKVIGKIPKALNKINKEKSYKQKMVYKAVTAYWEYPSSNNIPATVRSLRGSGLSFGFSIRIQKLLKLSRDVHFKADNNFHTTEIKGFASSLRVSIDQFKEFVSALLTIEDNYSTSSYDSLKKYGAVLVESSFRFKKSENLKMDEKLGQIDGLTKSKAKWVEFYEKPLEKGINALDKAQESNVELESIRIRVRNHDHMDSSKEAFRLGMAYVVGVNISYKKIRKSGNSGIFDLAPYWFINREKSQFEDYENAVPPVILLPHPFDEFDS